jgi:chromosome partitioning protein
LLAKALDHADVVVIPTRVGGVETPRVEAVLEMVHRRVPAGLVICSARTYTRDYQELVVARRPAGGSMWGTVRERVAIASGPEAPLSYDGLESYRGVWRRAMRAHRER